MRLTEAMIEKGTTVRWIERSRSGMNGSRDQREMMPAVSGMLMA